MRSWGYATGNKGFCALRKLEDDLKIRKKIAVLPDLNLKIYINDKIMPLTEFIVISSMGQFVALLKKLHEITLCNDWKCHLKMSALIVLFWLVFLFSYKSISVDENTIYSVRFFDVLVQIHLYKWNMQGKLKKYNQTIYRINYVLYLIKTVN